MSRRLPRPEPAPPDDEPEGFPQRQFAVHVFSVSAALVGVCFTGIGIVRLVGAQGVVSRFADDLLALDALLFLVSCILAYLGLRVGSYARRARLERIADFVFLGALGLMVLVGALLTYQIL